MRNKLRAYITALRETAISYRLTVGGLIEEIENRRHAFNLETIANEIEKILNEGETPQSIKMPTPEQLAKLLASVNGVDTEKPGWETFIHNAEKMLK